MKRKSTESVHASKNLQQTSHLDGMHDGIDATEKLNVGFLIIRQEFAANPKGGRSHPYDLGRRDVDFFQLLSDLGILLTADAEIAKHLAV